MSEDAESVKAQALVNIRNDISGLQRTSSKMEFMVERVDKAIEKISEAHLSVSKILAVHEQKIESQESASKLIQEYLEKRRVEVEASFVSVNEKMAAQEQGLRQDMSEYQKEILIEIKHLRNNMNTISTGIVKQNQDLKDKLEYNIDNKIDQVNQRINTLEKMSWIVAGGASAVGFLISQLSGYLQVFQ